MYGWLKNYSAEDKIDAIMCWFQKTSPEDFDMDRILKLLDIVESGEELTLGQEKGLEDIIKGWKISQDFF